MKTKDQVKALIEATKAMADVIKELKSVPSGHLYAQVMGHLSIDQYTKIIDILKRSGLIEEKHYELFWKEKI